VAGFDWTISPPGRKVGPSSGTSYAVAHLAGVAALWLAFWGHGTIVAKYGAPRVQAVFMHLVKTVGRRVPPNWDTDWGVGVVDAEALLRTALPDPDDVPEGAGAFGGGDDPIQRLSAFLGEADPDVLRQALEQRFGATGPELDELLRRFEGELADLAVEDDVFRESLLTAGAPGAFDTGPTVPGAASPHLRAVLAG
jgi:hypothetical protein